MRIGFLRRFRLRTRRDVYRGRSAGTAAPNIS